MSDVGEILLDTDWLTWLECGGNKTNVVTPVFARSAVVLADVLLPACPLPDTGQDVPGYKISGRRAPAFSPAQPTETTMKTTQGLPLSLLVVLVGHSSRANSVILRQSFSVCRYWPAWPRLTVRNLSGRTSDPSSLVWARTLRTKSSSHGRTPSQAWRPVRLWPRWSNTTAETVHTPGPSSYRTHPRPSGPSEWRTSPSTSSRAGPDTGGGLEHPPPNISQTERRRI